MIKTLTRIICDGCGLDGGLYNSRGQAMTTASDNGWDYKIEPKAEQGLINLCPKCAPQVKAVAK